MSQKYAKDQPKVFKNYLRNIAIVGAGGRVGKFIADEILANGKLTLTAITRKGSKNQVPEGVLIKEVDYDDHSSLVGALQGQDALIITMGVTAPRDQSTKLIKAAADANVDWIVPNEFGFNDKDEKIEKETYVGIPKKSDRQLIEQIGKSSWLGIACSFWYEFSLGSGERTYGIDLKNKTALFYDDGEEKIPTSTWPLTGKTVANLLSLKVLPDDENDTSATLDGFRNKFINVRSFKVSQKDMLASILRVTGDSIKNWTITNVKVEDYYAENVKKFREGNRESFARLMYSRAFFKGALSFVTEFDNEKLGLPVEDLDDFTKVTVDMHSNGFFEAIYS
ncbi:hypothetical protein HK098_008200 [Nowakowskiella sp. JEL0407]|nr:hypothetical protein HK098_008200 [Nowakowskiella sp. JEL0407]